MHQIDDMPEAIYHADPAPKLFPNCEASLSHSIAVKLLQTSPAHAWFAHPKLNPNFVPDEDKKFDVGSVAHKYLLESKPGQDPEKCSIAVLPYNAYRKDVAKEARDNALAAGQLPILADKWDDVQAMVKVARSYLDSSPELSWIMRAGKAESSLLWEESGVVLRARPDWITEDESVLLDYKTSATAEPGTWSRWMMGNNGYDIQAAFYLRGFERIKKKAAKFLFLVQEVDPPYCCSVIGLPPAEIALANDKVQAAIDLWKHCLETGHWPAYPARVHWIERPAFIETDWAQRKEYLYDAMFPQGEKYGI